jgi:phage protein D
MVAPIRSQLLPPFPDADTYAPRYEITVGGRILPGLIGDVTEVQVTMDMENISSFQLTVNNWDTTLLAFKYSDGGQFEIGAPVIVRMGYANDLKTMILGHITSLSPRFPQSGPPTIVIGGLDGIVALRDRFPRDGEQKKFQNMADWEIATQVAARNGLAPVVTQEGPVHKEVIQKNQDDAQFLKERAARINFECYVLTDPDSGVPSLHFVKPQDAVDTAQQLYHFTWRRNLIYFNPTITGAKQVSKVTVRGWDDRKKEPIVSTASGDPGFDGSSLFGSKEEEIVDAPVLTQEEADALARSTLQQRLNEAITASGQVMGLPTLRPTDLVEIDGVGERFDGRYYVKRVEHVFGDSGYLTRFDCRKVISDATSAVGAIADAIQQIADQVGQSNDDDEAPLDSEDA